MTGTDDLSPRVSRLFIVCFSSVLRFSRWTLIQNNGEVMTPWPRDIHSTIRGRCSSCHRGNPKTHHSSTSFPRLSNLASSSSSPHLLTHQTLGLRTHVRLTNFCGCRRSRRRTDVSRQGSRLKLEGDGRPVHNDRIQSVCDRAMQLTHKPSTQRLFCVVSLPSPN